MSIVTNYTNFCCFRDLAKCCAGVEGGLKLTLTGHINAIRGLVVSNRHPYLFSVGEDKLVNCWDLEYNKIIRNYHGHLSGVFCCALHPTLDLLLTGGRDSVARVWDIRTKHQIHVLGGHADAVSSIITNSVNPQVITSSHDSTIKLWDLAAGAYMRLYTCVCFRDLPFIYFHVLSYLHVIPFLIYNLFYLFIYLCRSIYR